MFSLFPFFQRLWSSFVDFLLRMFIIWGRCGPTIKYISNNIVVRETGVSLQETIFCQGYDFIIYTPCDKPGIRHIITEDTPLTTTGLDDQECLFEFDHCYVNVNTSDTGIASYPLPLKTVANNYMIIGNIINQKVLRYMVFKMYGVDHGINTYELHFKNNGTDGTTNESIMLQPYDFVVVN